MVLKVKGLNKSFKQQRALKDVSFTLEPGEIVTVLGPSGAGKTTLLRCINNLEKCDSGTIEIDGMYLCKDKDGKSIYAKSDEIHMIRKKIGMVFQNYNLFPHMSVLENVIAAPINVFNVPKKDAQNAAMDILNLMEVGNKAKSYPFELSGGQKQRVAIARACILSPKIMCLDEPTSALDPISRESIVNIIKNLAKNGMGILIITHDMAFAKRISDRVIFMDTGKIIEESSNDQFFDCTGNERIKKFASV